MTDTDEKFESILLTPLEVFDQVSDGIIICNAAKEIIYHNKIAENLLGNYVEFTTRESDPRDEILKYKNDGCTFYKKEELPMNLALTGKKVINAEMMIAYNFGRDPIWLSINGTPIKNSEGEVKAGVIVLRDISQSKTASFLQDISITELDILKKSLEERNIDLSKLNGDLKQKNEELEGFATNVAHDLRAPLSGITGFIEYINESFTHEMSSDFKKCFKTIMNGSIRMSQLIDELLDYALITKKEQEFVETDLSEIVTECVDLYQASIEKIGVKLETSLASLPPIMGSHSQIKRLIYNLIGNAIKYRRLEVPLKISIYQNQSSTGDLEFYIEDNGKGFDQKYAERIFTPLERLHAGEGVQGSGLGLALCRKIASAHGWSMKAFSRENVGSKFVIVIPKDQVS